ncbi:MAG TPA: hypothetical protein VNV25_15195 [Gemmatimonadaceae bacterium]|jgi:hypothetical protein|nr:hypothetical protein [Gemmatimonadaceae bacterium]
MRKWALLMLLTIAYSAIALGFRLAVLAAATLLTARGYGIVADILVLNYLLLSLPIFLAQIGAVVDVMLMSFGDASIVVPALRAVADRTPAGRATRAVASVLTTVSLFSSISAWALSMAVPAASVLELTRMKYRTEAGVLAAAFRRLRNRV